jgi:predicted dehydrogenase
LTVRTSGSEQALTGLSRTVVPVQPILDVVLIGTAGFGACWDLALGAHPEIDVVAVVDPDTEARRSAEARYLLDESACFEDAAECLAQVRPSLVIDSSPFMYRLANAMAALETGAHLIAAKPLGRNLDEAHRMVTSAATAGRRLVVAQQMRFFPCFQELRALLQDGVMGRPRRVTVRMALDGRGWVPGTRWRLALDQPLLREAGIHHFDLLRWVLDDEISVVNLHASSPAHSPFAGPATVRARLRSDRGVDVLYDATFAPSPEEAAVRFDSGWIVECDDGLLEVRDGAVRIDEERWASTGPTDEPVPLESLNLGVMEVALANIAAGRDTGPLSGRDNLASMELLHQAVRRAEGG